MLLHASHLHLHMCVHIPPEIKTSSFVFVQLLGTPEERLVYYFNFYLLPMKEKKKKPFEKLKHFYRMTLI